MIRKKKEGKNFCTVNRVVLNFQNLGVGEIKTGGEIKASTKGVFTHPIKWWKKNEYRIRIEALGRY